MNENEDYEKCYEIVDKFKEYDISILCDIVILLCENFDNAKKYVLENYSYVLDEM